MVHWGRMAAILDDGTSGDLITEEGNKITEPTASKEYIADFYEKLYKAIAPRSMRGGPTTSQTQYGR